MGLHMKQILFLLLVTVFNLSCGREATENSRGPQTTPQAIQAVQVKALNKLDPYSIYLGQKVHKIETQEVISSQAPIRGLSKEWITEVVEVENEPGVRLLTTVKQVTDHIKDKNFTYEFKDVYQLPIIENTQLLDQLHRKFYLLKNQIVKQTNDDTNSASEIEGVAYHNLQSREVRLVPPQKIQDAENCKGLSDCRINADLISYDVVFLFANGESQSHTVEWYISTDVPFFAGLLKQCATTLIPVESLRVLVRQCSEVIDYN